MAYGGQDQVVITVALDAVLTNYRIEIYKRQVAVGRMDAPWTLRVQHPYADPIYVDRPFNALACDAPYEVWFITTTAALPNGILQLVCSDGNAGVVTT